MSSDFQGQHGRAFLVSAVVNVVEGEPEERTMTTGLHVVSDIMCIACETTLGWRYIKAYQDDQAYKVGHYILEAELLVSTKA